MTLEEYYDFEIKTEWLADIVTEAVKADVFDYDDVVPVYSHIMNPLRRSDDVQINAWNVASPYFNGLDVNDYFFMVMIDPYDVYRKWTIAVPKKWLEIDLENQTEKEYENFWQMIHNQTSKEFKENRLLVLRDQDIK